MATHHPFLCVLSDAMLPKVETGMQLKLERDLHNVRRLSLPYGVTFLMSYYSSAAIMLTPHAFSFLLSSRTDIRLRYWTPREPLAPRLVGFIKKEAAEKLAGSHFGCNLPKVQRHDLYCGGPGTGR